jgi:hypothetical protein
MEGSIDGYRAEFIQVQSTGIFILNPIAIGNETKNLHGDDCGMDCREMIFDS